MLGSFLSTLVLLVAVDPQGPAPLRFSFDGPVTNDAKLGLTTQGVEPQNFSAGNLVDPAKKKSSLVNRASGQFDGTTSLLRLERTAASVAAFATGDFTWEGFFFSPAANVVSTEKSLSDRFITQFRDDKSNSSRLTVGLVRNKPTSPVMLSISLVGDTGRHLGKREVLPDVWHHFAVVYTAPKQPLEVVAMGEKGPRNVGGKIAWYLDYEKCGEVTFDGKSPATTFEPLGTSPVYIGGRKLQDGKVDRGFAGLLDELRIWPRALKVDEFQRTVQHDVARLVKTEFIYPLAEPVDWKKLAARPATESLDQETLGAVGTPQPFSLGGFADPKRGAWGVRSSREFALKPGRYRLLVRTAGDALLEVDGRPLVDARVPTDHPLGPLPASLRDYAAEFQADGKPHTFRLTSVVRYTATDKAPQIADTQPGEAAPAAATASAPPAEDVIVGYAAIDPQTGATKHWRLLGPDVDLALDAFAWSASRGRTQSHWKTLDDTRRAAAIARGEEFWKQRHAWAASVAEKWKVEPPSLPMGSPKTSNPSLAVSRHEIDAHLAAKMQDLHVQPAATIDDVTFLRRATLDLNGRNPTIAEARAFAADTSADRRDKLVDRLLASPEWADAWVGYWQDLLAENPSILKPTLNNSGPFRRWIHDSFAANKPMDRFAVELILMQGDDEQGGTAGFALSSGNDLPMAMKGHVLAQAFLGVDMKCARCHDAPFAPVRQSDLFGLAAMLEEKPLSVPKGSTVVVPPGARQPNVTSSLKVGDRVVPEWPLAELIPPSAADEGTSLAALVDRPRARLASIIVSPSQPRFSDVLVNRVWQRFMGTGLVEPVDGWLERSESSHPELLAYLSREFVRDGYDMKRLVRRIVTSDAYRRRVGERPPIDASQRTFAAQARRRMSAEQVVDSLFAAVGKPFHAEELNFDPNKTQGFLTLPAPERSWQFASLSNERDRPALALPVNQMILDVLTTFGWRETRPDPWTRTDAEPNPLQPLMMANSTVVNQVVRLTEDNLVTEWCVEDVTLDELVERMFLATLARKPTAVERKLVADVLADGYAERRTGKPKPPPVERIRAHVDWDKHLKGESSIELLAAEKQARAGDPPTVRLTDDFRRRVEDVLWSLVNSPEFVFVP
jgi:hypothetical protein